MPDRLCVECGAVVTDGPHQCPTCRRNLHDELRDVPELLRELDITLSRQTRTHDRVGRRSAETPVAFHVGASTAITDLRAAVDALSNAGGYVTAAQIGRFRAARRTAYQVIDLATCRMFIGACTCEYRPPLYAPDNADEVTCRYCHAVWPAKEPDTWSYLEQAVGPLTEVRQWMLVLGVRRTMPQLYRDARGVAPVVEGPRGAYYRLTDVLHASWRNGAKVTA